MDAYPEDWKVVKLGEYSRICRGGSPRPIQNWLTTESNGVNWIKIGDVKPGARYIEATEERIKPEGVALSRPVHVGDFVLSNSMSFGRPYILKIDGCIHDGWLAIQEYADNFDSDYLQYVLSSEKVYEQYIAMAAGSSVKNLNKEKVADVTVPKPPRPEQRRIAAALGDMDKVIDNLSKRIDKKKAIKQGAMQELLTGKKRLPGFSGEWVLKELGQLATMFSGGTPPSREPSYYGGGIPWVSIGDMTMAGKWICTTEKTLSISGFDACSARMYPPMSLLFAMYASIGKCCISKEAVSSSQAILGLYDFRGVDIEFLFQNLSFREAEFAAMGQTGTQSNLSKRIVSKIKVHMPKDIPEQRAIAKVLGDMDAEIVKLEAKREKLVGIKKGMMSDLLTGKVRLKTEEKWSEGNEG